MRKIFIVLIVTILLLIPVQVHAETNLTVYRDESHGQYYKSDSFSVVIDSLKESGINVQVIQSDFLSVVKNADPKTSVIVIPNPSNGNFTSDEIAALKDFVAAGGVLILMSDVQYVYNSIPRQYGKPGTLNQVVFGIDPNATVRFEGTDDNGNEIYDDANNNGGKSYQIKVFPEDISPMINGGIEDAVIVTTSMVHVEDNTHVLAFTHNTAYAKDIKGNIIAKGNIPRLAYLEYGEGKVILSGSTQGFTDKMVSYSTYNKILFINLISRATGTEISITALKFTLPILDIIMIRLSMTAVVLFDLKNSEIADRRERIRIAVQQGAKYVFILAILFATLAAIQAYMMKAVFITTAFPGRSQPSSLENVPMRANARGKYLFAMLVDGIIGLFLGLIALRIEKLREIIIRYRNLLKFV